MRRRFGYGFSGTSTCSSIHRRNSTGGPFTACVGSALGMPSLVSTCFAGDGMGNEWRDCGHPVVRSELGSQACEGRASEDALDPPLDPPLDRGIMVTAVGAGSAAKKPHVQCVRRSDSPAAGK